MKKLVGFALGTLVTLSAAGSAWAAGNVAPQRGGDQAIEVIVVTAKRPVPGAIEEIVVTPKRPSMRVAARIPPAMPIEKPRLEFAVAAPPVVRF